MRTLVVGEALVDLICEHPVTGVEEADLFRPYFGGAAANVSVAAARRKADIALAGGVGDDPWGRWLHRRLQEEGVGLDWFSLIPHTQTPVAFVTVDTAGEPDFVIYGDGIKAAIESVEAELPEAIEATDAFAFASNTLVGHREREITLMGRDTASSLGRLIIFDPNLRLHRWPSPEEAIATVTACVPNSFLLKCNAAEARMITGAHDLEAAALALVAAGAKNVVITLGENGAMLRGSHHADAAGRRANVINATGAGDAFLGTLIAELAQAGYDDTALIDALPLAVEDAARATEHWGAI